MRRPLLAQSRHANRTIECPPSGGTSYLLLAYTHGPNFNGAATQFRDERSSGMRGHGSRRRRSALPFRTASQAYRRGDRVSGGMSLAEQIPNALTNVRFRGAKRTRTAYGSRCRLREHPGSISHDSITRACRVSGVAQRETPDR